MKTLLETWLMLELIDQDATMSHSEAGDYLRNLYDTLMDIKQKLQNVAWDWELEFKKHVEYLGDVADRELLSSLRYYFPLRDALEATSILTKAIDTIRINLKREPKNACQNLNEILSVTYMRNIKNIINNKFHRDQTIISSREHDLLNTFDDPPELMMKATNLLQRFHDTIVRGVKKFTYCNKILASPNI